MREGRNTGIQKGLEEGLKEGLEKGKWQKTRLFVFRADRKGMYVSDIAELVDLPEEEVEVLIQEVRLNPPEEH
jgi:flagellar biosynthesis/type III secretory pathway protein FliH